MTSEIDNKYVIFKLSDEYYGVPINNVLSIEKVERVTRVPNAPKFVNGVINLRGEVIPLIDLAMKFQMVSKGYNQNSRIIVVSMDAKVVGLIVDSSSEVLNIDKENIDSPPRDESNECIEFISGVGKVPGRLIILLDLAKILKF